MAEQMIAGGQGEALEGMLKMVPIGRYGRAEEVADVVLWLSSSASSLVVGCKTVSISSVGRGRGCLR